MNVLDFKEELHLKIVKLSQNIWEHKVQDKHIESWLHNFEAGGLVEECEQSHALYLLSRFMFFGVREIREMLKSAFRDKIKNPLIQDIRKSMGDIKDPKPIIEEFDREVLKTRFLGMGNPSESGTHLLYFFRQENNLSKELFIHGHQILRVNRSNSTNVVNFSLRNPEVKRYIFMDDVAGSGTQAVEYSKDLLDEVRSLCPVVELHYVTLFSTKAALEKIREETAFDKVDCIFELDDTFKCFSDDSRYFSSELGIPVGKEFAKNFCLKYGLGMGLCEEDALGYKGGQLLIGFSHNVPDNTLPIIWSEYNGWEAIFKRYTKMY